MPPPATVHTLMTRKAAYGFMIGLLTQSALQAQSGTCPPNIGFENGTFLNWRCDTGRIRGDGVLELVPSAPIDGVHNLFGTTAAGLMDPYGDFPILCPNGSNYSVQLGNNDVGAKAERISYTFTIPPTDNDYSIIYNYAVVIQNPDHAPFEQPKFTAAVFDVTANAYVSCGSFEFVASSSLPGFVESPAGDNIFYKPWSPVTINLNGFAGKTIRIEFTNNDCSRGGHFGYAYLDIQEDCTSPIKGTRYCTGDTAVTLTAPFGFQAYRWFNASFTQVLGTQNTLQVHPIPPPSTIIALELTPYPNLGCTDTVYTTIEPATELTALVVKDSLRACFYPGANLTDPAVTAGSPPFTYTYFLNRAATIPVPAPKAVRTSGTYYLLARNAGGCTRLDSTYVTILPAPNLQVQNPLFACSPSTANLTAPSVVAGSAPSLQYSYWKNDSATVPLPTPADVGAGLYYIRAVDAIGCYHVKPSEVRIADFSTTDATVCGQADLSLTTSSAYTFTYSYWTDLPATLAVAQPRGVTSTGTYYIRGTHTSGCTITKPVSVLVNPNPVLSIAPVPTVDYPATVNLPGFVTTSANTTLSYWLNAGATQHLANPAMIDHSGTYFVKAIHQAGCSLTRPVIVTVNLPENPLVEAPNVFTPNGDGINDLFRVRIIGYVQKPILRFYNRWGQVVSASADVTEGWNGMAAGKPVPTGTYYWVIEGYNTVLKRPYRAKGFVDLLR
ncbi:MAG: hypothetical protein JWP27_1303 [Flaviaesturariibacter sp.]|nr:hypothetical protein [Flaviaesturariibacter sp.]